MVVALRSTCAGAADCLAVAPGAVGLMELATVGGCVLSVPRPRVTSTASLEVLGAVAVTAIKGSLSRSLAPPGTLATCTAPRMLVEGQEVPATPRHGLSVYFFSGRIEFLSNLLAVKWSGIRRSTAHKVNERTTRVSACLTRLPLVSENLRCNG